MLYQLETKHDQYRAQLSVQNVEILLLLNLERIMNQVWQFAQA